MVEKRKRREREREREWVIVLAKLLVALGRLRLCGVAAVAAAARLPVFAPCSLGGIRVLGARCSPTERPAERPSDRPPERASEHNPPPGRASEPVREPHLQQYRTKTSESAKHPPIECTTEIKKVPDTECRNCRNCSEVTEYEEARSKRGARKMGKNVE